MDIRYNQLRDQVASILEGTVFLGRPVHRFYSKSVPDTDIPCAMVFFGGDVMTPDGSARHGEPHFEHSIRINVAALVRADSEAELDALAQARLHDMLDVILRNAAFQASEMHEGVERVTTAIELPDRDRMLVAEVQIGFILGARSRWQPYVETDLVRVRARYGIGDAPQTGFDLDDMDQ